MVLRKKTGWEHYANHLVEFIGEVLLLQINPRHLRLLESIADGTTSHIGLVWNHHAVHEDDIVGAADEAALAVAIALWNAACWARPTLLWTGRRSVAAAWIDHAIIILSNAVGAFKHDFKLMKDPMCIKPWGLLMPNGAWALRFDGVHRENPLLAAQSLGNKVDVLIGDFEWTDRAALDDAIDYVNANEAMMTVVVGVDGQN